MKLGVIRPGWFIRQPGSSLLRVVFLRVLTGVPLVVVVSAVSFALTSLTPGNAAQQILGSSYVTQATYEKLVHSLGLDRPLYVQYWRWAIRAIHGDLGMSFRSAQPVTTVLDQRLPVTLSLIGGALLVTTVVGVGIGMFGAIRGGRLSRSIDGLALVGFALPSFWVGAILISLFTVDRRWFPTFGYVPFRESPRAWLISLVLPVIALALHSVAAIAKQTREAMLDSLGRDYIRMAWARGISPTSIFFRHALKNAAIRVVTVLGLLVVGLLGGTILVEAVFALPGLGGLAVDAAINHDRPVLQGLVVYFTIIVLLVNTAIDVAYRWLDPRVGTR